MNLLTKEIIRLQEENEKLKSRLKTIESQVTEKYLKLLKAFLTDWIVNVFCLLLILGNRCIG